MAVELNIEALRPSRLRMLKWALVFPSVIVALASILALLQIATFFVAVDSFADPERGTPIEQEALEMLTHPSPAVFRWIGLAAVGLAAIGAVAGAFERPSARRELDAKALKVVVPRRDGDLEIEAIPRRDVCRVDLRQDLADRLCGLADVHVGSQDTVTKVEGLPKATALDLRARLLGTVSAPPDPETADRWHTEHLPQPSIRRVFRDILAGPLRAALVAIGYWLVLDAIFAVVKNDPGSAGLQQDFRESAALLLPILATWGATVLACWLAVAAPVHFSAWRRDHCRLDRGILTVPRSRFFSTVDASVVLSRVEGVRITGGLLDRLFLIRRLRLRTPAGVLQLDAFDPADARELRDRIRPALFDTSDVQGSGKQGDRP